jgi:hypothetical protein|tara:strand:+ start:800 stop:1336 length:537 start_codon:yes stop_codon:yes gene_type:complete
MKKKAPFQLRSGNKPSPAKLLGVLSGKTKFKDSKVGKAINPEGKKVSITIGDKKFGDTKVGKFLKGFGPRSKAAKPTTTPDPEIKIPNASKNFNKKIGVSTETKFNVNKPKPKTTKPKSTKPKTTFKQAFNKMERVAGKTRMSFFRKNPHTGELYPDSDVGLKTFTDQAKAYNKKKGQ